MACDFGSSSPQGTGCPACFWHMRPNPGNDLADADAIPGLVDSAWAILTDCTLLPLIHATFKTEKENAHFSKFLSRNGFTLCVTA